MSPQEDAQDSLWWELSANVATRKTSWLNYPLCKSPEQIQNENEIKC